MNNSAHITSKILFLRNKQINKKNEIYIFHKYTFHKYIYIFLFCFVFTNKVFCNK